MNAIGSAFVAFWNQKITKKGHKFCLIFDLSHNLLHKKQILKNYKKALRPLARPIALKTKWTYGHKF